MRSDRCRSDGRAARRVPRRRRAAAGRATHNANAARPARNHWQRIRLPRPQFALRLGAGRTLRGSSGDVLDQSFVIAEAACGHRCSMSMMPTTPSAASGRDSHQSHRDRGGRRPHTSYAGRYMHHCHVLEHDDRDMMRPFVNHARRPDAVHELSQSAGYAISTLSALSRSTRSSWLREVMSSFTNTLRRW